MVLPIAVLGTMLRNFGLDVALIQRPELDRFHVNAVFWLALKLNLLLSGVLAALAPALAWFYDEPRVLRMTLALAIGVLSVGSAGVHEALLKRQMRFGILSAIALGSAFAGASTAIALAMAGAGYWALVAQLVVGSVMQCVANWAACDWRPGAAGAAESDDVSRALVTFGRHLTLTRILTVLASYIDRILIGWISGPAILGLYENGRRLPFFALDRLYEACFSVAISGFSRAGTDAHRYRAFGIKAVQLVLAVILPALAYLMIEAEYVLLLFLGEQWLPAAPYARLLAIAAYAQALTRTLQWFYLSSGETLRQLRWIALQTIVTVFAAGLGAWMAGTFGVALGITIAAGLLPIPAIIYGLRGSHFSARDFGRAATRPIVLSLGSAALVGLIMVDLPGPTAVWLRLSLSALLFTAIYFVGWTAPPSGRLIARELLGLLVRTWRERRLRRNVSEQSLMNADPGGAAPQSEKL
jgi:PST family polysaccharide transporter